VRWSSQSASRACGRGSQVAGGPAATVLRYRGEPAVVCRTSRRGNRECRVSSESAIVREPSPDGSTPLVRWRFPVRGNPMRPGRRCLMENPLQGGPSFRLYPSPRPWQADRRAAGVSPGRSRPVGPVRSEACGEAIRVGSCGQPAAAEGVPLAVLAAGVAGAERLAAASSRRSHRSSACRHQTVRGSNARSPRVGFYFRTSTTCLPGPTLT
jgi:hypothetical protein